MPFFRRLPSAIVLGFLFVGAVLLLTPPRNSSSANVSRGGVEGLAERFLDRDRGSEGEEKEEGNAWDFFEWWYGIRAYPNELIPKSAYFEAWQYSRDHLAKADLREAWEGIGPDNIGGRMLALALDPNHPDIVWAGAASGGLWKSTTGGEGASAWTRIETGYPSLSVSAVVIDPIHASNLYIGTGEISLYARPLNGTPGARASYGIGVLRSTDGGVSWETTGLNWTMDQQRAVLALRCDPVDPSILWAATSEGLYKTTNSGTTWVLSHPVLMAMDVVIDSQNHNKIFVSHGQLNSTPNPGIYRSMNGGDTWTQLSSGLPSTDFGRTPLAIYTPAPGGATTVWAGVSNAVSRQVVGLYKSTNNGDTWVNVSAVNWAGGQAWYDNVVGVSPHNHDLVLCGGLDWYRSTNGGAGLGEVSYWYVGYEGVIPPGGPEGPPNYVHADQHAVAFHPTDPDIVYIGCDGGVFKSTDGGVTWAGKNGGLVTTQFYAGFAGGYATSGLAVGGLQDNGTVKYTGSPSWSKIFGGDGGWCAIDPRDENIIYEEYVYLDIYKSWDGGQSWSEIHAGSSGEANFIAPFVLSESSPDVVYAGTRGVQKSTNGGASWFYPDGNSNWNGTAMAVIGVSTTSPDTLLAGTGSGSTGAIFEVRRSVNGGLTWANVTAGLPNRYPTDISYNRSDSRDVWMTFSGYGTPHVFHSLNAGLTWADRSGNLPNIPVQCVVVDPLDPNWLYLGTDLGIYTTIDGGANWVAYNNGMPQAMILDLVIHPSDRRMRAATFGNGVYEIGLPSSPTEVAEGTRLPSSSTGILSLLPISPNPARESALLRFSLRDAGEVSAAVFDASGRQIRNLFTGRREAGTSQLRWDGRDDAGARMGDGVYFIRVSAGTETKAGKVTLAG